MTTNKQATVVLTDVDIQNLLSLLRKEITRMRETGWENIQEEGREHLERLAYIRQDLLNEQRGMVVGQSTLSLDIDEEALEIFQPLIEQELAGMKKDAAIEYFEALVYLKVLLRESLKQFRGKESP